MRQTLTRLRLKVQCLNFQVCLKIQLQKWVGQRHRNSVIFVVTSTEKLLTRPGFELAPSETPVHRCTSIGLNEHTVPSDWIAQLVERRTVVPEGASSNHARVKGFSVDVSSVRKS